MGLKLNAEDIEKLNSLSRVAKSIRFSKGNKVAISNENMSNYATTSLSNAVDEEFDLIDIDVLLKNIRVFSKSEADYDLDFDSNTNKLTLTAKDDNNSNGIRTFIDTTDLTRLKYQVPLPALKVPSQESDVEFDLDWNVIDTAIKLKGVNKTDIMAIVKREENDYITLEGFLRSVVDANGKRNDDKFIHPVWSIDLEEYYGEAFIYYFDDKYFRIHSGDYKAKISQYSGDPLTVGTNTTDSKQLTCMSLYSVLNEVDYIFSYFLFSRNQKGLR